MAEKIIQKPKYTIRYSANGGTGAPVSQIKIHDKAVSISTRKPTRTGYDFQGWARSSYGPVLYKAGSLYTTNANITLYAVWSVIKYDITYNGMGGTGAPPAQQKEYGRTLTLRSGIPRRTGYDFLGWGTTISRVSYSPGGSYALNRTAVLYAVWRPVIYTVKYNVSGGAGCPAPQKKVFGKALKLSTMTPRKAGYDFQGWSTNPKATKATYSSGALFQRNGDTLLYAVWTIRKYLISYNANGGTGAPSPQTKTHGKDIRISSQKPKRAGCKFLGWSLLKNAEGSEIKPGILFGANKDTTLYAVWNRIVKRKVVSNVKAVTIVGGDAGVENMTIHLSYVEEYYTENQNVVYTKHIVYMGVDLLNFNPEVSFEIYPPVNVIHKSPEKKFLLNKKVDYLSYYNYLNYNYCSKTSVTYNKSNSREGNALYFVKGTSFSSLPVFGSAKMKLNISDTMSKSKDEEPSDKSSENFERQDYEQLGIVEKEYLPNVKDKDIIVVQTNLFSIDVNEIKYYYKKCMLTESDANRAVKRAVQLLLSRTVLYYTAKNLGFSDSPSAVSKRFQKLKQYIEQDVKLSQFLNELNEYKDAYWKWQRKIFCENAVIRAYVLHEIQNNKVENDNYAEACKAIAERILSTMEVKVDDDLLKMIIKMEA